VRPLELFVHHGSFPTRGDIVILMKSTGEHPSGWRYLGSVGEGERLEIHGINVWGPKWNDAGTRVPVEDPIYHQPFMFRVYEITSGEKRVLFAAGE
jgi:hypothetical protein